ncbi:MAG: ion channel [Nostoc sp.]|uniref:ion channel n=1 Tax=Nostoc sp. TaxID=1180 RepID=UPI002FF66B8A
MNSLFAKLSTRRRRPRRVQIHIQDGRFNIVGMNAWYSHWRDPYHLILTIPWQGFAALVVGAYLSTNVMFALLFLAGGDCVANAAPGSFWDCFFFSVQTLGSIGYGAMFPQTVYANTVVMIESMSSLIGIAMLTGLAFARFSNPTARVVFTEVATISPHESVPTLSFRMANQRSNQILEAQLKVYLLRDEVTAEGQYIRRIYDLSLVRSHSPSFALSWLVLHPIDESSPLSGVTAEALVETNSIIVVSLSGVDETVTQMMYARHTYAPQDILWNYRFKNLVYKAPDGDRYLDYKHFHDVMPLQ